MVSCDIYDVPGNVGSEEYTGVLDTRRQGFATIGSVLNVRALEGSFKTDMEEWTMRLLDHLLERVEPEIHLGRQMGATIVIKYAFHIVAIAI